jgi:glutamine synthetase
MAKTAADVLKLAKENDVKFVDFRFTDTRGKEQHVTVPVSHFGMDKFEEGHAFDGSSIAGWKGIQASDMLLMPDADSVYIDPFMDEVTMVLSCDVVDPTDGKGYDRDPRSIAKRAEAYLKASGVGDTAYFGPEPEFFIFDSVNWQIDMSGCFVKINSEEAAWSSAEKFDGGNTGHRPTVKGGYFPVPPVDSLHDIRAAMCLAGRDRHSCRSASSRSGDCRPVRNRHPLQHTGKACRLDASPEICDSQRGAPVRQDRHFHA